MNTTTAAPQRTTIADLQAPQAPKPTTGMRDIAQLPKAQQFPRMLEAFKKEIAIALPAHMNADRMARIALTCFRQNPKLAECEPQSVFACIVVASQLGLEPGLMGQAYLVPFKKKIREKVGNREVERWVMECQLIPGYQGLVDLARRSGRIKSLEAHVVYSNDHFECAFGINPVLVHKPNWDGDRGEFRLAYAVAQLVDGGVHVEVMSRREIEQIRDRSQNVQNAKKYNKTTPWDTDADQMRVKTLFRRICKFLPKSVELASALALEAANARGRSQEIDLRDAIEGEFSHVLALDNDDGDEGGQDEQGHTETGDEQPTTQPVNDSGAVDAGGAQSPEAAKASPAPESPTASRRTRGSGPLI